MVSGVGFCVICVDPCIDVDVEMGLFVVAFEIVVVLIGFVTFSLLGR